MSTKSPIFLIVEPEHSATADEVRYAMHGLSDRLGIPVGARMEYGNVMVLPFDRSDWAPISSAPKDGTTVRVWNGSREFRAKFEDNEWLAEGGGFGGNVADPIRWQPISP